MPTKDIPVNTPIGSVEPLSGEEESKRDEARRQKRLVQLRAFVQDELVVVALHDQEIAESICFLAGLLGRSRPEYKKQLTSAMKSDPRWGRVNLIAAWDEYAVFLEQVGGNHKEARRRVIELEARRSGKKQISDGRMQNLLSEAATTIPLEDFAEHARPLVKERLDRGRSTSHRGNW